MSIYSLIFSFFAFCLGLTPYLLYDVHMLQLNSYRTERYLLWLRQESLRAMHLGPLLALVSVVLWPFIPAEVVAIAWSSLFIILFLTRNKTPQKKKLVITSRVMRLLAANLVLMSLVIIISIQLSERFNYSNELVLLIALPILGVFFPFVVCLSNILMQPLEKSIGRYFYNDAKRILSQHAKLQKIGITGSYGKTSTKFILQQCLASKYQALATPDSFNTTLGVVRVIRERLRPIHEFFIAEMGARQTGDIQEICALVQPKIGIITAIGEQHLETFKDISTIAKTKLELFAALPPDGIAVYNLDNQVLRETLKPIGPRYVSYAIDENGADYMAADLSSSTKGTEFTVTTKSGESLRFRTRLLGRHNISNILAAIAVSAELGIPLSALAPVVANLKPAPHRLEVRKTGAGVTILDNAFSSNPQGAQSSLEVLAALEGKRKIMITPGMVELGSREYELNKIFGMQAASVCDHIILVGAKRAIPIREGLLAAGYPESNIYIAADLRDGQKHLEAFLQVGDVLLYENDLPDTYNEIKA